MGFCYLGGIMIIKQMLNNNVIIAENEKIEEVVVMGKGLAYGAKKRTSST